MASKRGRRRFDPEDEGRRSAPRGGKKGARKDAAPHYEIDLHGCTAACSILCRHDLLYLDPERGQAEAYLGGWGREILGEVLPRRF